ncbi:MAG: sulfurtransferase [Burkholderiales bacterium]|nr:sulfurtransferase [Burkholderiales bacterium]
MLRTLIDTDDLEARLNHPGLVLLDVRHDLLQPDTWGRAQYAAGHLPGAHFVHLDHDLSGPTTGRNGRHPLPTPEAAAATFGRLGIGPGCEVVVYDQAGGILASRAWWMLRWLGFLDVAVLDGGYAKWAGEGRTLSTAVGAPRPATFTIRAVTPTVDASGIMGSLARRTLAIVDARSADRFRGDTEPMDRVAGHIPGARNRPCTDNLAPGATFKTSADLRREFAAVLGDAHADTVVHQCGSGVSACHNILAMEIAGFSGTRLYPGSWSEWCADPQRPVATGPADSPTT